MDVRYLAVHLRRGGAFTGTLSRAAVGGRQEEEEEEERQGGRFWEKERRREAERGKNKQGLNGR